MDERAGKDLGAKAGRRLEPEDPRHAGSFVDVRGAKVFFRSAGSGSPIVLLHGFPSSSYDWREFLAPLSKFGRVIAPDLYGFGYSEAASPNDLSKFVQEFAAALSIDRFTLGGYDRGGSLALEYAIENPGRVSRLIVMNATTYPDWVDHARKSSAYAPTRRMMSSSFVRSIALTFFLSRKGLQRILAPTSGVKIADDILDQQSIFYKRGIRNLAKMRPVPYTEPYFAETEELRRRLAEKVQDLRMPTLLVFGEDDPYFPVGTAEHLHGDIAGSTLHVLEHTGHVLTEERPKEVIDLIVAFLAATAAN
jgi:pimeloyl-ACP methyl ester carboxylesterase